MNRFLQQKDYIPKTTANYPFPLPKEETVTYEVYPSPADASQIKPSYNYLPQYHTNTNLTKIGSDLSNSSDSFQFNFKHHQSSNTDSVSSRNKINPESIRRSLQQKVRQTQLTANGRQNTKADLHVEMLLAEISKLTYRVNKAQQKIEHLEKNSNKYQQSHNSNTNFLMRQDINRIFSLVEKSQNREDHHKAMSMIDELRQNILQLNSDLNKITFKQQEIHQNNRPEVAQQIKSDLLNLLNNTLQDIKKYTIQEAVEINHKFTEFEAKWNLLKNKFENNLNGSVQIGFRKFQGSMITLLYEQKITQISAQSQNKLISQPPKQSKPKQDLAKKVNIQATITKKIYYLDSQGYLLDKNKCYLLNQKNKQIRLSEKEIKILKLHNLLSTVEDQLLN